MYQFNWHCFGVDCASSSYQSSDVAIRQRLLRASIAFSGFHAASPSRLVCLAVQHNSIALDKAGICSAGYIILMLKPNVTAKRLEEIQGLQNQIQKLAEDYRGEYDSSSLQQQCG